MSKLRSRAFELKYSLPLIGRGQLFPGIENIFEEFKHIVLLINNSSSKIRLWKLWNISACYIYVDGPFMLGPTVIS